MAARVALMRLSSLSGERSGASVRGIGRMGVARGSSGCRDGGVRRVKFWLRGSLVAREIIVEPLLSVESVTFLGKRWY